MFGATRVSTSHIPIEQTTTFDILQDFPSYLIYAANVPLFSPSFLVVSSEDFDIYECGHLPTGKSMHDSTLQCEHL